MIFFKGNLLKIRKYMRIGLNRAKGYEKQGAKPTNPTFLAIAEASCDLKAVEQ